MSSFSLENLSQISADCLDCHTIALWTGIPVFLDHTTVVSLWLVKPIVATSSIVILALIKTSLMTSMTETQMANASASTQPECGNKQVTSL